MKPEAEATSVTEEELDELLAAEAGMTVAELRERSAAGLSLPWESEIVTDHDGE